MKQALREAGVPTAASTAAAHVDEVYAFADAIGFPLILKPRTGAGGLDTDPGRRPDGAGGGAGGDGAAADSIAVEAFVEGHEGFYDTLSVDGTPQLDFVSSLLPERAGGDADALDLAAVRGDQPDRHRGRLPAAGASSAGR